MPSGNNQKRINKLKTIKITPLPKKMGVGLKWMGGDYNEKGYE